MQRDFEDNDDVEDLDDDELQQRVRQELNDQNDLDAASIVISVSDGVVHLSGRVGTDAERQIAGHVVTDVLGIVNVQNRIVADRIYRDHEPDELPASGDEESDDGLVRPRGRDQQDPEAAHLAEDAEEDLYGAEDAVEAVQDGTTWSPPSEPTPEGVDPEDGGSSAGEQH